MNFHIRKSKLRRLLVLVAIMVAASITAQLFNTTNTDTTFADQNDTSAFVRRYKIPSGYTTFTDANFYDCVANNYAYWIGTVPSTGLTDAQLKELTSLECNQNSSGGSEIWTVRMVSSHSGTHEPNSFDIADTKGLEKMTNLENLNLDYNNKISQINLSSNPKSCIKATILDQTIICGLGNIYADEALFASHIHPERKSGDITKSEAKKLLQSACNVMDKSIDSGGSTMATYVKVDGTKGDYLELFAQVFRREGQPCPHCGTEITKIRVAGRGTHICPRCQK